MKRSFALPAVLLTFSLGTQAEVTFVRSFDVDKVSAATYEVTCYTQYFGIDPTHEFNASASIYYGGNTTYPYGARIGPTNRRVTMSEPGVWDFTAVLRKGTITVTRVFYLSGEPTNDGSVYSSVPAYCLT